MTYNVSSASLNPVILLYHYGVRMGYEKSWLSTNISLYLGNDSRYGHNYNARRIGSCMRSIEWCHKLVLMEWLCLFCCDGLVKSGKYHIHFLKITSLRICCSSGVGVGLVMNTASWSWLKRGFGLSISAEAAPVSDRSGTSSDPGNIASSSTKLELGNASGKEIVLVTGGAGFLGQHIVRLLQERSSNVKEIRVFDTRPYRKKLGKFNHILITTQ